MLIFNGKSIFDCDRDELSQASDMLKRAWSMEQQKAVNNFKIGDKVQFDAGNRGGIISGIVTKINQKTISVKTDTSTWKVSGSLLSKIPSEAYARQ